MCYPNPYHSLLPKKHIKECQLVGSFPDSHNVLVLPWKKSCSIGEYKMFRLQTHLHDCIMNSFGFLAKEGQLVLVNLLSSEEMGTVRPSRDCMTSLLPWLMKMTTHISLSWCSGMVAK